MSDEKPAFDSDEVEDKINRKKITRHRLRSNGFSAATVRDNRTQINDCLATIYQDPGGRVPDMKKIAIKKTSPFGKILLFLCIVAGIMAALVWATFFLPKSGQDTSQLDLALNGPSTITLGAPGTFSITYSNNYPVALKNVSLNVYYPTGFSFETSSIAATNSGHTEWDLGDLAPGASGSVVISGETFGNNGEQKTWHAFLNYTPSNFNSELQKSVSLTTKVGESPLTLTVSGPDQIAVGSPANFTITVNNNGSWTSPVALLPVLPPNFALASSSPELDSNNQWSIPYSSDSSATSTTFTFSGQFTGIADQATPIQAMLLMPGVDGQTTEIANASVTPALTKSNVAFDLAINGSLADFSSSPGSSLAITLHIKNTGTSSISNVVPELILQAPSLNRQSILDWSNIQDKNNGNIIGQQLSDTLRQGTITWDKTLIPALVSLQPGDEVEIDVELPIKDNTAIDLSSISASTISATANLNYQDSKGTNQTLNANPITITINSDLQFSQHDASNGTEHSVGWTLENNFHDLKNISITATAFGDVDFSNQNSSVGTITYDTTKNQIIWNIPELPAGASTNKAGFQLTLKKNNPSQSTLLSAPLVTAEDTATGKTITETSTAISL